MAARVASVAGSNRCCEMTVTSVPALSRASMISSVRATVSSAGFSTMTCLPARNASMATSPCNPVGVHTTTTSISSAANAAVSDGYAVLRPHVEYIQIKDALAGDGTVVPAGKGDGEVDRTIRALHHDGFDGFFSLEPHLSAATATGGFSGEELFRTAWQAFTDLLTTQGIEYT